MALINDTTKAISSEDNTIIYWWSDKQGEDMSDFAEVCDYDDATDEGEGYKGYVISDRSQPFEKIDFYPSNKLSIKNFGGFMISDGKVGDQKGFGANFWGDLITYKHNIFSISFNLDDYEVKNSNRINIGPEMFQNWYTLKKLYLNVNSGSFPIVPVVRECAFQGCNGLTDITADRGTSGYETQDPEYFIIEKYAFNNCSSLQNIRIKITDKGNIAGFTGSVENSYSKEALGGKTKKSLTDMPNGYIGKYAFHKCSNFDPSKKILDANGENQFAGETGEGAFSGSGATAISFLNNIKISAECFQRCKKLTRDPGTGDNNRTLLALNKSVEEIGDSAFESCSALWGIWLDKDKTSLKKIGKRAFADCDDFFRINHLKDQYGATTKLSDYDYNNREYLDNKWEFPEGLKTIGDQAFLNNPNVTEIIFPTTLTSLGASAFQGCTRLTKVTFKSQNLTIGEKCFEDCTNLQTIDFNTVTNELILGNSAFEGCNIQTLDFSNMSNIVIGSSCFANNINLYSKNGDKLYLPSGLRALHSWAFSNTGLVGVEIDGTHLATLGQNVFVNCSKLKSIIFINDFYAEKHESKICEGCKELIEFQGAAKCILSNGYEKNKAPNKIQKILFTNSDDLTFSTSEDATSSEYDYLANIQEFATVREDAVFMKFEGKFLSYFTNKIKILGNKAEGLDESSGKKILYIGNNIISFGEGIPIKLLEEKTVLYFPGRYSLYDCFADSFSDDYTTSLKYLFYYGDKLAAGSYQPSLEEMELRGYHPLYQSLEKIFLNSNIAKINYYSLRYLNNAPIYSSGLNEKNSFNSIDTTTLFSLNESFCEINFNSFNLKNSKQVTQEESTGNYILKQNNGNLTILLKATYSSTNYDFTKYTHFAKGCFDFNSQTTEDKPLTLPFIGGYWYSQINSNLSNDITLLSWMLPPTIEGRSKLKHLAIQPDTYLALIGTKEQPAFANVQLSSLTLNGENVVSIKFAHVFSKNSFNKNAELKFLNWKNIPAKFLDNSNIQNENSIENIAQIIIEGGTGVTTFGQKCFYGLKTQNLILYLPKQIEIPYSKASEQQALDWFDFKNKLKIQSLYYGGTINDFNNMEIVKISSTTDSPLQHTKSFYVFSESKPKEYNISTRTLATGQIIHPTVFYNNKIINSINIEGLTNDPGNALGPDNAVIEIFGEHKFEQDFTGDFLTLYHNYYKTGVSNSSEHVQNMEV